MPIISVVIGSIRSGRFCEKPARWIFEHLKKHAAVDARLLDLQSLPMPFYDHATSPATPGHPPFEHAVVQKWTRAIGESDGFVFVTPEYNHGVPAALKNAIDWVYPEWNRKAAAFVSYGGVGGARCVEHLRGTMVELQIAPIRSAVHIPANVLTAHFTGGDVASRLAELDNIATAMIVDLLWWVTALKSARAIASEVEAV